MIFATNLVNSSATRATCRFLPSEISFHVLSYPYRSIVDLYTAFNFHFNLQINIVKHPGEIEGKSTAVHAKLVAPDHVNIHIYPDIPDYTKVENMKCQCQLNLTNNHHYFVAGKGCISFPWQGKQRSGPISNDFMRQY